MSTELDLLTVNLWGLPWPLSRERMPRKRRLTSHLMKTSYDVVGIQELWWPWRRTFAAPELRIPHSRRDSGLAVAGRLANELSGQSSAFRVSHFRHHRGPDLLKRKGVLWADVAPRTGPRLRIGVAHLQAERRHAAVRARQVDEILTQLGDASVPVVLMGDFNFYADRDVDQRSAERLEAAGMVDAALAVGRPEPTYGVARPGHRARGERFDRVYLRDGARGSLSPLQCEVVHVEEGAVSDHHPLRVRIRTDGSS